MSRSSVTAPTDRSSVVLMGIGGAIASLSVLAPATAVLGVPLAALIVATGWRHRVFGRSVVRTHAALQAITRGQMEEAEAHLDAIPRWLARRGTIMRSVAHQRGLIAFYRGDAPAATHALEPATSTKTKGSTRNYEHMQRGLALSLRALTLASMGESERARADVADVLASAHATPESLARARLAEAVVLARAGASDALVAHFRAHGSLMLEYAYPRERVLARALRKMVQTRSRSVYREAARPEEAADAGALGQWIAGIAPDAAQHATEAARLTDRAEVAPPVSATEEDLRAMNTARAEAAKSEKKPRTVSRGKLLALWAVVLVLIFVIYRLLAAEEAAETTRPAITTSDFTTFLTLSVPFVFLTVVVAMVIAQMRRGRKVERDVLAAQRAIALGDMPAAEPLLVSLERSTPGLGAAQALFMRAKHAEQQARFEDCIALCDRALGSIASQVQGYRTLASMALTPSIAGLRGLSLAALGRTGDATAELATIGRDHATWSHRTTTELRIRLLLAVRRGDLDAARAVARERTPELPITLRDEALADLVLATAPHGASRDEQERVDTELREDLIIQSWIDAVAPNLRDDLARRVTGRGVRVETDDGELQADESELEDAPSRAALRHA